MSGQPIGMSSEEAQGQLQQLWLVEDLQSGVPAVLEAGPNGLEQPTTIDSSGQGLCKPARDICAVIGVIAVEAAGRVVMVL